MPTPRAYDELYRKHEELRWRVFMLLNAMTAEEEKSLGNAYDSVWEIVGDCDGPPLWLAAKLEEEPTTMANSPGGFVGTI